ncbi:hypothetical protein HC928_02865 [bacterium]|nr:hypothetical protein [bacterium]
MSENIELTPLNREPSQVEDNQQPIPIFEPDSDDNLIALVASISPQLPEISSD